MRRIPPVVRIPGAALLAGGLLVSAMLVAPAAAYAAPQTFTGDTAVVAASELSAELAGQLGAESAGSYVDATTGNLVVTVTSVAASRRVRAAGAVPRTVRYSGETLEAATGELSRSATIAGTSWAVDPKSNQVVVTADSTVTGAKLEKLKSAVAGLGDKARLESTRGVLSMLITGGDAIYTGGARCSLGFNVLRGGIAYVLTAGHCTNIGVTWTGASGQVIGNRVGSWFPGNDFGLIQYTGGWNRPGAVNLYDGTLRDISGAANPVVGQTVGRSGSTTGLHRGTVTGLNATVNYPQGTVTGMIRTSVCAEPGDSGGSLFAGNTALGLTSGGSGNCSAGGETFFQPVVEALNNYGVSIY